LALKGIAAVGPTLDLWGQIGGGVTVSGNLRVGASYTMSPIELYVPNTDETYSKATAELQNNTISPGLDPIFEAQVQANVSFDVHLTPEVDMGIHIGGFFGIDSLVTAQVAAFANTTLHFYAGVTAETKNLDFNWSYNYGVDFLYQVGVGCIAEIYKYGRWASGTFPLIPQQTIHIYGPIVFKSVPEGSKRSTLPALSESPLPGALFGSAKWPQWTGSGLDVRARSIEDFGISNQSYHETGGYDGPVLTKRDDIDPGEEDEFPPNTFNLGSFTCTTGQGSRCPKLTDDPPADIKRFVDYSLALNDPNSSTVTRYGGVTSQAKRAQLEKRVPTDCPLMIPRFYCK
jgi:hypothetical protein